MSATETQQNMLHNISDNYDKSEGSFVFDVTKASAIEIANQQIEIDNVINKLDVEKLVGDELTRFVYQRTGISRKLSSHATTSVLITGTPFTTLEEKSLVAAEDIFYEVIENSVLSEIGTAAVKVKCLVAGIVGNVPSNTIKSFPMTIANITSVINTESVTNGFEAESDADLRTRYYDKLQRPGKAGNKYHYAEWAKSVIGVGKVKVFPRWNGPLTVKVVIVNANGDVAKQTLIDSVYKFIESERPFGATVTVSSATYFMVNIKFTLIVEEGYEVNEVLVTIKKNIEDYFKKISFEETISYVSQAQIGREILEVPGVIDYQNLLLNDFAGNVHFEEEEIPKVGTVSA